MSNTASNDSGLARRATWWRLFGLLTLAGVAWMLATPPLTGPDEVFQARRAAALARGQLRGNVVGSGTFQMIEVDVPDTYVAGGDSALCFVGAPVPESPQRGFAVVAQDCPPYRSSSKLTTTETGQYRGQPFYWAVVGLPSLIDTGVSGTYLMRLVGIVMTTALLASAAVSTMAAARRRLASVALFGCVTPMVLYLAASTNPSSVEIAAAIGAWTTGMLLTQADSQPSGREVARFGVSMVVLVLARGLGPLFAVGILAVLALLGGKTKVFALVRRRDLRAWAAGGAAALLIAGWWLWFVQQTYAPPERPGSGVATAIGYLPFYIRQSIGVFGQNDSAIPPLAAWVWVAALLGVFAVGLWRSSAKTIVISLATLVAGLALSVTAEGLSLPPIGFFWQGRYALPVLLGAFLLATCTNPVDRPASARADTPDDRQAAGRGAPWNVAAFLHTRRAGDGAVGLALGLFMAVHASAFLSAARHHGAKGGDPQTWWQLLSNARWSPPLTFPLLLVIYLAALGALAWRVVGLDATPPPRSMRGGGDHTALRLTAHR